jgi:hypothetical protein
VDSRCATDERGVCWVRAARRALVADWAVRAALEIVEDSGVGASADWGSAGVDEETRQQDASGIL